LATTDHQQGRTRCASVDSNQGRSPLKFGGMIYQEEDNEMRQVIIIPDKAGGYVVTVPSLPGCISQGKTIEEALVNIQDAIQGYIEVLIEDGEDVPEDEGFIVRSVPT
jgi:predicted RNase H-like HicB family nuclease